MSTPRPCVMLWLAREGPTEKQYAAYERLIRQVKHPEDRSTIMVGDEPDLVEVETMVSGLPLNERYDEAVLKAAKQIGFKQASFVLAVLFRNIEEAPPSGLDELPLRFIGRFEFPFPERGDFINRDDHEWLGIDSSYCLDEKPAKPEDDDGYIGHF